MKVIIIISNLCFVYKQEWYIVYVKQDLHYSGILCCVGDRTPFVEVFRANDPVLPYLERKTSGGNINLHVWQENRYVLKLLFSKKLESHDRTCHLRNF